MEGRSTVFFVAAMPLSDYALLLPFYCQMTGVKAGRVARSSVASESPRSGFRGHWWVSLVGDKCAT